MRALAGIGPSIGPKIADLRRRDSSLRVPVLVQVSPTLGPCLHKARGSQGLAAPTWDARPR